MLSKVCSEHSLNKAPQFFSSRFPQKHSLRPLRPISSLPPGEPLTEARRTSTDIPERREPRAWTENSGGEGIRSKPLSGGCTHSCGMNRHESSRGERIHCLRGHAVVLCNKSARAGNGLELRSFFINFFESGLEVLVRCNKL